MSACVAKQLVGVQEVQLDGSRSLRALLSLGVRGRLHLWTSKRVVIVEHDK